MHRSLKKLDYQTRKYWAMKKFYYLSIFSICFVFTTLILAVIMGAKSGGWINGLSLAVLLLMGSAAGFDRAADDIMPERRWVNN